MERMEPIRYQENDIERIAERLAQETRLAPAHLNAADTALSRGRLIGEEVDTGLFVGAYDLEYLIDTKLEVRERRGIAFGLLLEGDPAQLTVADHGEYCLWPTVPVVLGFDEGRLCTGHCHAGSRAAGLCVRLLPDCLDRLAADDDSFGPLQALAEGGFCFRELPRSRRLADIGRQCLDNPYDGLLERMFLQGCALSFIAEAIHLFNQTDASPPDAARSLSAAEQDRVAKVGRCLDENIVSPPSLNQLGIMVGLNVTTLTRHFRQVHGMTIFEYLRARRLELAREMLRLGTLPVSQIGYRVGFSSPAAFTTAYRRRFGLTPSREKELRPH
jgi:AraC-like DNA-binding protein